MLIGVLKGATCPGQGDLAGHTSTCPSAALYGMHLFGQDLSEDEGNHLRFLFEQSLFSKSVRIPSLLACLNYSPMMSKESPSPVYMASLATSLRIIYFYWRCRRQDKIINADSLFITLIFILVSQNGHLVRISPVRYIDMTYRLSIYRHFWKISISISISIWRSWKYRYR